MVFSRFESGREHLLFRPGGASVLKGLFPARSLLASDFASFRRQESIFITLNLLILAVLLSLHSYFASFWGKPAPAVVIVIWFGIFLKSAEFVWLRRLAQPLKPALLAFLTWSSIAFNLTLASGLAVLTNKEDTPYFVLMIVAVLEVAFRFELPSILAVLMLVSLSMFGQVWWYFRAHSPLDVGEYFEAGTSSLLFATVAVLVWLLVGDLRRKETHLANNVLELERAREQLLREEKLAAMGRLSSAIAHEIRNPVAMIASSIAIANQLSGPERDEMFDIAAVEANRLSQLTTDFLDYASTRPPKASVSAVADTIAYVADASRAHANQKRVHFEVDVPAELRVKADPAQLQQALMNLVLNAVDASPAGGTIVLHGRDGSRKIKIDVENTGLPIAEPALSRIFEPFFTTKPRGTGLGLAIARNIARTQGGDLVLARNGPDRVCFSLILPAPDDEGQAEH